MPRKLWVDKTFAFELPVNAYEEFLRTLAAAPDRVAGFVEGLDDAFLKNRPEGRWSIQENVGHLMTLEGLFVGRLDDYDAGSAELRAADMTNAATDRASHNDASIGELVEGFRRVRGDYLSRLIDKPQEYFSKVAWHPRLEKPMRVVDQLEFHVAHDAHHLERIEELL